MGRKHKPRSGSLSFYPKKRARSEKPRMNSFRKESEAKPLNFFGYKAGMTHIISTDQHQKSPSYGQKVQCPATVIECPPIKVVGYRAYGKTPAGLFALGEEWAKDLPKDISRRIASIGKKKKEEKAREKKPLDAAKEKIKEVRLIGCLQCL